MSHNVRLMTIIKAPQLVSHCSPLESRRDVSVLSVLDIGEPVKIVDTAT